MIRVPSDPWIEHAVHLERVSVGLSRNVFGVFRDMKQELEAQIKEIDPTGPAAKGWRARRLETLYNQANRTIASGIGIAKTRTEKQLVELAWVENRFAAGALNGFLDAPMIAHIQTPKTLESLVGKRLLFGHPHGYWWKQQEVGLRDEFARRLRLGVLRGEGIDPLVRRIRGTRRLGFSDGIMAKTKRQVETLVRTSVQSVVQEARVKCFEDNDDVIMGIEQESTLDGRTTVYCRARDNRVWSLPDYKPVGHHIDWEPGIPVHFNCRSSSKPVMVPWDQLQPKLKKEWKAAGKSLAEMDDAENRIRASMDGPVTQGLDYEHWLRGKPVKFQKTILGQRKWDLWQTGKITQTDLIDQHNNPLSVSQLEELVLGRGGKVPAVKTVPPPPPAPKPEPVAVQKPKPAAKEPEVPAFEPRTWAERRAGKRLKMNARGFSDWMEKQSERQEAILEKIEKRLSPDEDRVAYLRKRRLREIERVNAASAFNEKTSKDPIGYLSGKYNDLGKLLELEIEKVRERYRPIIAKAKARANRFSWRYSLVSNRKERYDLYRYFSPISGESQKFRIRVQEGVPVDEWFREMMDQAEEFYTKMSRNSLPRTQIRTRNTSSTSAFYNSELDEVFLLPNDGASTIVHEYGHAVESWGVWREDARAYQYKGLDDADKKLIPIHKIPGYEHYLERYLATGREELVLSGWQKKGWSAYVSKVYNSGHTEVVSMGMERMFDAPRSFSKDWPEYFDLILKVLGVS